MIVQSIINTLESTVADRRGQNLSGYVKDFDSLLTPEHVASLEAMHEGVFAFFAFQPQLDTAVTDYLRHGSLADDTGPHVFALFTLDVPAHTPVDLSQNGKAWLTVTSPAATQANLIRSLFPSGVLPAMPCLIFFERLSAECEPVAVSLSELKTAADVRTRCAKVFQFAGRSYRERESSLFAAAFAKALAIEGLQYHREGSTSVFEWFVKTLRFLHANAGTIVSVVKLF